MQFVGNRFRTMAPLKRKGPRSGAPDGVDEWLVEVAVTSLVGDWDTLLVKVEVIVLVEASTSGTSSIASTAALAPRGSLCAGGPNTGAKMEVKWRNEIEGRGQTSQVRDGIKTHHIALSQKQVWRCDGLTACLAH